MVCCVAAGLLRHGPPWGLDVHRLHVHYLIVLQHRQHRFLLEGSTLVLISNPSFPAPQQLSYHFMVHRKLFSIKVIWLKYLIGNTHANGVCAHTQATRASTHISHTPTHTHIHTHNSQRPTHMHTHMCARTSLIQPVWCVFTC